jgi:hypothetical protein
MWDRGKRFYVKIFKVSKRNKTCSASLRWEFKPFYADVFHLRFFDLRSFALMSFDLRSFALISFDLRSFDLRSFALKSFDLMSFDLRSFDLRSFALRSFDLSSFDLMSFDLRSFDLRSFALRSFDLRSFDLRSFDLRSFDLRSFDLRSFELMSFDVRSFDVRSFNLMFFDLYTRALGLGCPPLCSLILLDVTQQRSLIAQVRPNYTCSIFEQYEPLDRTSGQCQVKLSLLRSISVKIRPTGEDDLYLYGGEGEIKKRYALLVGTF